jgi:cell wall-associated NlpC family hydrolase
MTSCTPLLLDVASSSKKSGANVHVYIANGANSQKFTFVQLEDGSYTVQNKNSGMYLMVQGASTNEGANVCQGRANGSAAQKWKIAISPQGGLLLRNVASGKYLEVADGQIRLKANVRQTASYKRLAQSFQTVMAGYNPIVGKIGWQNPTKYPQVSRYTVKLPSYATGYHTYVTPSRISVDATREECVEAFIQRAYEYLGTPFVEPWSQKPGVGVDCSGLVLQCLYATGMDLESAAGSKYVGGYNPYNHYNIPAQTYNSSRWYESGTFQRVSVSNMRRGDLVFYGNAYNTSVSIGHVAIYLGDGQIIHSTNYAGSGNKVRIDSVYIWTPLAVERPFV